MVGVALGSMSKSTARLFWLVLGVAFVGCVLWFRRPESAGDSATIVLGPVAKPAPVLTKSSPSAVTVPRIDLLSELDALLRSSEARTREALLTFKDDASLQAFVARAGQASLTIVGQLPSLRSVRVRYDQLSALHDDLLAHAGDLTDISGNYLVGIPSVPAREERNAVDHVPFGNRTLDYLGANPRGEDYAQWGRGVTIAVLDSGVNSDVAFGPNRLSALDIGFGLTPSEGREGGHGTAVAALAAGGASDAAGVAPAANVLSIRVTDDTGVSDLFTLSNAIIAAVDAGAKVVNISLGGYATAPILDAALGYASQRGAVVVAAAGNDQAAQLAWPAADPRVVSVGAIDAAEQQVLFSNSGAQLQLSAPGYGVQSAWLNGERVTIDGTSASAPLVAGAIAALLSQNPSLTPHQAAQLLARTASDGGAPGTDPAFGRGILNLAWAMNANTAGYIDTAISSHHFNPATNRVEVVVQNRGTQSVTGLKFAVQINGTPPLEYAPLPTLAPGQTWTAHVPADSVALKNAGQLVYTTQLTNPGAIIDAKPANNKRSSVLLPPAKR
jgi:hypothetical protein